MGPYMSVSLGVGSGSCPPRALQLVAELSCDGEGLSGETPTSESELSHIRGCDRPIYVGRDRHMDLSRVVALANGKGGVGKTSLTANLAGEFAREGSRVLVIDLDISGNLKLDLGLVGHPEDDAGQGIVQSIVDEEPLHIVREVRPGVDWVPGGPRLNWLLPMAYGVGPGIPAGSLGRVGVPLWRGRSTTATMTWSSSIPRPEIVNSSRWRWPRHAGFSFP